jgi:hypothetical protein
VELTTSVWLHQAGFVDRVHQDEAFTHEEPFHKLVIALLNPELSVQYSLNSTGVPAVVELVEFNE